MSKSSALRRQSWAPTPRGNGSGGIPKGARRAINPRWIGRPHIAPPRSGLPLARPFGGVRPAMVPFGKLGRIKIPVSKIPFGGLARLGPYGAAAAAAATAAAAAYWWYTRPGDSQPWGGGYDPDRVLPADRNSFIWPDMPDGYYTKSIRANPARLDALPLGVWNAPLWWIWEESPLSPAGGWLNESDETSRPIPQNGWYRQGNEWWYTNYYNGEVQFDPPTPVDPRTWPPPQHVFWYVAHGLAVSDSIVPATGPEFIPEPGRVVYTPEVTPENWPQVGSPPIPAGLPFKETFPIGTPWDQIVPIRPIVTEPVPAPNGDPYPEAPGKPYVPDGLVLPTPSIRPGGELVLAPGAQVRPSPHSPSPPGTPERKGKSRAGWLLAAFRITQKNFHNLTEYGDFIEAIYEALPKWLRKSLEKQNGGKPLNMYQQTVAVMNNLDKVDISDAIQGVLYNQVEDYVIGKGFKSVQDAANRLGIKGAYKLEQPVLDALDYLTYGTT